MILHIFPLSFRIWPLPRLNILARDVAFFDCLALFLCPGLRRVQSQKGKREWNENSRVGGCEKQHCCEAGIINSDPWWSLLSSYKSTGRKGNITQLLWSLLVTGLNIRSDGWEISRAWGSPDILLLKTLMSSQHWWQEHVWRCRASVQPPLLKLAAVSARRTFNCFPHALPAWCRMLSPTAIKEMIASHIHSSNNKIRSR